MTALHFATTLTLSVVVLSSCATNNRNTDNVELDLSSAGELQLESLIEQPNINALSTDFAVTDDINQLVIGEEIEELSITDGLNELIIGEEIEELLLTEDMNELIVGEEIEELLASQALETEFLAEEEVIVTPISAVAPAAALEEPETAPAPTPTAENTDAVIVEVTETFYRLKLNPETNVYDRTQITEARPGNLIELVVSAQNKSNIVVRDVELNNTVPSGPITLLPESIATDTNNSIYRISRNGETFFPADAELEPSDIRFIQWVIIALQPEESIDLKYRFTVNQ